MLLFRNIVINDSNGLLNGLLGCWELDETSGTKCYDETVNSYDLDSLNATLNQTGILNKAVLFTPNATPSISSRLSYGGPVSYDNSLDPQAEHSISIWFKRLSDSSTDDLGSLASKYWSQTGGRIYMINLYNSSSVTPNRLRLGYWDTVNVSNLYDYDPGSDIWTNNWVHLLYSRSGDTLSFYINGAYISGSTAGNGLMQENTGASELRNTWGCVGRSSTTPDLFFDGLIDQTAVWEVALGQSQVNALYNSGSGLTYSNWT